MFVNFCHGFSGLIYDEYCRIDRVAEQELRSRDLNETTSVSNDPPQPLKFGLVALTVFAVGEGFSSVLGNADGKTVSATVMVVAPRSVTV
jgi:hypothetical protein